MKKSPSSLAESRYVKGRLNFYARRLRNISDAVKGCNFTPAQVYYYERKITPSVLAMLLVSSLDSFANSIRRSSVREAAQAIVYRYTDYCLPEDLGLPREWFFAWWERVDVWWQAVFPQIRKILKKSGWAETVFLTQSRSVVMFRDWNLIKEWLKQIMMSYSRRC